MNANKEGELINITSNNNKESAMTKSNINSENSVNNKVNLEFNEHSFFRQLKQDGK